jgi:hypothetical protein
VRSFHPVERLMRRCLRARFPTAALCHSIITFSLQRGVCKTSVPRERSSSGDGPSYDRVEGDDGPTPRAGARIAEPCETERARPHPVDVLP